MHGTVGIAHGMGIFAQDERFLPMLLQERPHAGHRGIHLAFHIGGIIVAAVVEDAFVMHQPGVIQLPEALTHGEGHLAADGFVADAPNQDAGMVLVPVIGGIDAIQHGGKPILTIPRQGKIQLLPGIDKDFIPHAVAFQIVFCNEINAQLIAKLIQSTVIRIMAGAQRIDVVPLHGQQIPADHFRFDRPARLSAEVMPIHALEHDALTIQAHDAILHFKAAEAHLLTCHLAYLALSVFHGNIQAVQLRMLSTPLFRSFDLHDRLRQVILSVDGSLHHRFRPIHQGKVNRMGTCAVNIRHNGQGSVFIVVIQFGTDGKIPQVLLRQGVQVHIPKQTAEAEEILVLCPAAGAPVIHTAGQLISAGHQIRRQVELAGGEAIPCKAYILAVQPHCNAAFCSLERDMHRHSLHGSRQGKGLDIARNGIVVLRNLPGFNFLTAIPRVLNIHILRNTVAFQLNVCRNRNILPIVAVILRLFKARNHLLFRAGAEKLPVPIQ